MSLQPIRSISQLLFAILLSLPALAQQLAPSIPSTGFAGLDQYRASRIAIYTDDFGQLARYRDVIDLHPKVVVVLAGTNDIAGVTGPTSNEDIEANLASMAELARAHRIWMVFASVLPVHNYTHDAEESFALRPRDRILALNKWLKDYCAKNRLVYLDYFSALVDERGMLKRALADDGLHPTDAGYKIMAPLAEKAIQKALAESRAR